MKLTGQCEIDFQRWYNSIKEYTDVFYSIPFRDIPDSMKYGVYEKFFLEVGKIYAEIPIITDHNFFRVFILDSLTSKSLCTHFDNRNLDKLQQKIIEKENLIYNKNHNDQ